jgi:hypothetical protein
MKKTKKQETGTIKPAEDSRRFRFPVIEGITAAAAQIGASERLLKSAKANGCKAFLTGNRVDTGQLLPFLFGMLAKATDLPDGVASPQDWLATEKAKREQLRRKADEGKLADTSEVKRQAGEAGGYMFAELERWSREMPPSLAGLSAVEVGKLMAIRVEQMRTILTEKLNNVGE